MELVDVVEQLVLGGVALTTRALADSNDADLTFPQWRVLVVLGDAPQGRTVSEVASRVGVTLPAMSRQLRRMERRGLVVLERDELDRRAMRATLTAKGASVRAEIIGYRRREIARTVAPVELNPVALNDMKRVAAAMGEFV